MFKRHVLPFMSRLLLALGVSVMLLAGTAIDSVSHAYSVGGQYDTGDVVHLVRESDIDPDGPWYDVYDVNLKPAGQTHYNELMVSLPVTQRATIELYGLKCGQFCVNQQGWIVGLDPNWAVEMRSGLMLETTLTHLDGLIEIAKDNRDKVAVAALQKERRALVKLLQDLGY